MNFLDVLIIIIILTSIMRGISRGFLSSLIELMGIILSAVVSLVLYIPFSGVLNNWGVSQIYSGAIAFIIIWCVTLVMYNMVLLLLYQFVVPRVFKESYVNKVFGIFPGFIKGIIVVTLILTLFVSLPVPIFTKEAAEKSGLASPFLDYSTVITSIGTDIFGEPIKHAFGFFTIETGEEEYIELDYIVEDPAIDPAVEDKMLDLLNQERKEKGLPKLVMDETLREIARGHSIDMFQKGYFSHVAPDGGTAFDRLQEGGVTYIYAGENLAVAPSVSMAHEGLMNSPGHKANILYPEYGSVGIGAARGGRHGIMFTQKFTD